MAWGKPGSLSKKSTKTTKPVSTPTKKGATSSQAYNPLSGGSANTGKKPVAVKKVAPAGGFVQAVNKSATGPKSINNKAQVTLHNAVAAAKKANNKTAANVAKAAFTQTQIANQANNAAKKAAAAPVAKAVARPVVSAPVAKAVAPVAKAAAPAAPVKAVAPAPKPVQGSGTAGQLASVGGAGMTAGQLRRLRQSRGPRTGESITPEMLQAIARQRIVNYR